MDEREKGFWRYPESRNGLRYYYRIEPKSHNFLPLQAQRHRVVVLAKRLREVIDIEKPDLLHAHSPVSNGRAALKVGHKLGLPVIYEMRYLCEEAGIANRNFGRHSWKFKLLRFLETRVCRKADQLAVISNGLKNHLIERGLPSERITVVSNGAKIPSINASEPDSEYKNAWKLEGKKVIGYIGTFCRYEGLDLLVDAIDRLSEVGINAVLLLVGNGQVKYELEEKIRRLGLKERIIMPGRIAPNRIPGVYALIDILAYPRYSMPLTELVTPLKPLEAMAMGKAVAASDIGGHRELIQPGQNGVLFPPNNLSGLVKVLIHLLNRPDFRRQLESRGFEWVSKNRSWDMTLSGYASIYRKALMKSGLGQRL